MDKAKHPLVKPALGYAGLVLGLGCLWASYQFYLELYRDERQIYPLSLAGDLETISLQAGDWVEQEFVTTKPDLLEMVLVKGQMAILGNEEVLNLLIMTDELPAEVVRLTPELINPVSQVRIMMAKTIARGSHVRFRIQLESKEKGRSISLPVVENQLAMKPPHDNRMKYNDIIQTHVLVFSPVYKDGGEVLAGDQLDYRYEGLKLLQHTFDGRPGWVQIAILVSALVGVWWLKNYLTEVFIIGMGKGTVIEAVRDVWVLILIWTVIVIIA